MTTGERRAAIVVVVAGPDGVGKSTVTERLANGVLAPNPLHLHHRPRLLPKRSPDAGPVTNPHADEPYPAPAAAAKLVYLYLDFLLGWLLRVRPAMRGGRHVLLERGWWDLVVDPARYRLPPWTGVYRALSRLLPRPTLSVVLTADSHVLLERKSELPEPEVRRQLQAWSTAPVRHLRAATVDASSPIDRVLAEIEKLIRAHTGGEVEDLRPSGTSAYTRQFLEPARAAEYEHAQWARGSYPSLLWREVEQPFLERFLRRFPKPGEINYLDFACGTGRILAFLERRVGTASGVDVSPAMLQLAQERVESADLLCLDLGRQTLPLEHRYDLITAFRFILNAEPNLRSRVLKQLAERLKDDRSRLLFDNHGNATSYKALRWPHRLVAGTHPVAASPGNVLRHRQVKHLIRSAGLEIEAVYGYGYMGGRSLKSLPASLVGSLERRLAGVGLVQRLGVHQLYICRRTTPYPNDVEPT